VKRLLLTVAIGALYLAAPHAAHADSYLVERCVAGDRSTGTLVFDETTHAAAFWVDADPVHKSWFGTFEVLKGANYATTTTSITMEPMHAVLTPTADDQTGTTGSLAWQLPDSSGRLDCQTVERTPVQPPNWLMVASALRVAPPVPTRPPPVVASPPQTAPPSDSVPLEVVDNEIHINVMVGGRSLRMVLDTGATHGSVPTSFGEKLLAEGVATEGPPAEITLADNSKHMSRTIIVRSVTIGAHTAHDVHFELAADDAEPLLGFRVLSAFGKFSIDAERGVLTFG
jgi:hypothetical protein